MKIGVLLVVFLFASSALAVEPDEVLDDPVLEARALDISRNLRCVVCQSQSIDESNAPLAKDMRIIVRERLVAGDTNAEVYDYLVDRYGDYVLLRPPLQPNTAPLWIAPALIFAIAAIGGWAILLQMKRQDSGEADDDAADRA